MKVPNRSVGLPGIPSREREKLQPFLEAFDEVLLGRVRCAGFRKASQRTLCRITSEIQRLLQMRLGHPLEPGITLFALRWCGRSYADSIADSAPIPVQRAQLHLIDSAWRLIVELEEYNQVAGLMLLTRSF